MIAIGRDLAVVRIAVVSLGHFRAERYPHHIPFPAPPDEIEDGGP
jgi:hypothetical protein